MKRIENPDLFTLENHAKNGRLLAKFATIVVAIAFAANVYNAHIHQQSLLRFLDLPSSFSLPTHRNTRKSLSD